MVKSLKGPICCTIAFISIFSILITSCAKIPADPSNTASGSSSQTSISETSSKASEAPTPTDVPLLEQSEAATTITAKELGIYYIAGSYFYWSPDTSYAIFVGAIKDDKNKLTENVYLYKLQDKKITKIVDGVYDKNFWLGEPRWSADSTLATIPFYEMSSTESPIYLYDIAQGKLDKLPVTGTSPSISPDKNKVAYSSEDNELCLFNLSNRTITIIPGKIKGWNFIWFSDSARILFINMTGKNPSGLEGAELEDICIIDIKNPTNIQSFGYEHVYRGMSWIEQESLAWVITGWDDGYSTGFLDLDSKNLIDFGEFGNYNGALYQTGKSGTTFILVDKEKDYQPGFKLLDRNLVEQGKYLAEIMFSEGIALGLLPDGNLLYLSRNPGQNVNTIMLSYLNAKKFVALSTVEGSYIIIRSKDGSRIALVSQDEDKMILIDTTKIKVP